MRTRDRRISRLRKAIDESPVRRNLLREAYEFFTEFGELPEEDDRLAFEVVQQALRDGEEQPLATDATYESVRRKAAAGEQPLFESNFYSSVRSLLFGEAITPGGLTRELACWQIAREVAIGGDVESPGFCARYGMPMFGSVALHIAGGHRRLILPPYEFQAKRLLARVDNLRGRIPREDSRWFEEHAKAFVAFRQTGALPRDDLQFEMVLANVELDLLEAHRRGKDVAEAMALFKTLRWKEGEEQQAALARLQAMAAAGQLPYPGRST